MSNYDQAQTSRLGQVSGQDNTLVIICDASTIPEAPWHGMLIYRSDTQMLMIYRSSIQGGNDAFEEVIAGTLGRLTFVGTDPPTAHAAGDLWFDTDANRTIYIAAAAGANEVTDGEWELLQGPITEFDLIANDALINALTATNVFAEYVYAGFALLGNLNIGGDAFTLTPAYTDSANMKGGMRILNSQGVTQLPADGSTNVFAGNLEGKKAEIAEGADLSGPTKFYNDVTLLSTPIPSFPDAPTVVPSYGGMQLQDGASLVGYGDGPDSGRFFFHPPSGKVRRYEATVIDLVIDAPEGTVALGKGGLGSTGMIVALAYDDDQWKVYGRNDTQFAGEFGGVAFTLPLGTTTDATRSAVGYRGGNPDLVVAVELKDEDGWTGDLVLRRYDTDEIPPTLTHTLTVPSVGPVAGVQWSPTRWWVQPVDGDVQVFDTAGVRQPSEEWPRPLGLSVCGWARDLSGNAHYLSSKGIVRTTYPVTDAPGDDYWVKISYTRDLDDSKTDLSSETKVTRPAGAGIMVYWSSPQNPTEANRTEIAIAQAIDGPYYTQGKFEGNAKSFIAVSTTTGFSSGLGWQSPLPDPAKLQAGQGGFWVDGESNGELGEGTFRDEVQAIANAAAAAVVDAAPGTLDTLNELAAALGDDPNFATTVTNALATKATQAALDAEIALARNADNLTSGTVADARIASTIARDSEVTASIATSESGQVRDGDAAGGVLSGTYPNPGFAVDMATQAELDAHVNNATDAHDASAVSYAGSTDLVATTVEAALDELDAEKQPLDATLTGMAAVSMGVADRFLFTTGADTFAAATITSFGRSLINDTDAAEARTTLLAQPLRYSAVNVTAAGATAFLASWELNQVYWNNAAAQTLEIPDDATTTIVNNARFNFMRLGAGSFTITPAAGVTLNGKTSSSALVSATVTRYGQVVLWKRAANIWSIIGDFT